MRGEVGKETAKKEMDLDYFMTSHMTLSVPQKKQQKLMLLLSFKPYF